MKLTLCIEQTLGHRAHTNNLARSIGSLPYDADIVRVEYGRSRLPVPWAVRGSLAARRILRSRPRAQATLFHTQSVSLFASQATRGQKYAVSVDATPAQMDGMGFWYQHGKQPGAIEAAKGRLYRQVLKTAAAVVAWSDWAVDSLEADYGVPRAKTVVVHPGASPEFFALERTSTPRVPPTVLFVGGDFDRKGGRQLWAAAQRLQGKAEFIFVTQAAIPPGPGIVHVADATPGSERLLDCYRRADIFCLPTFADCTSVAVGEAMAAGLAVVTTDVGSNRDLVHDGTTGLLVKAGSVDDLDTALRGLIDDGGRRVAMGRAAREIARDSMDAHVNAGKLLQLLESVA
jgi:glycosyltransferase involved in cell wall biosynthesis